MRRMWQKYTPGKRVLALLLAVLMLCDTFTVSAATTEGEVSTEVESEVVEVTDGVTEPEENLVEEEEPVDKPEEPAEEPIEEGPVDTDEPTVENPEAEEPVVEEQVEEVLENGEETTEPEEVILEGEVEQLKLDGFTLNDIREAKYEGATLTEDETVYVSSEFYGCAYVYLATMEQLGDGDVTLILTDSNGSTVTGLYTHTSSYWFEDVNEYGYETGYAFDLTNSYGINSYTLTITNPADETDQKTYTIQYDGLLATDTADSSGTAGAINYIACEVGKSYVLSTKYAEEGVFGYATVVATDSAVTLSAENMSDTAKAEWNANYQSTYGEYGKNGKYYFFTYSEGVYGPKMNINGTKGAHLSYYHMDDEEAFVTRTIYASDLHLKYNGQRLYHDNIGKLNYIKFGTEDLVIDICNGERAYTGSIQLSSVSTGLDEAISVATKESGEQYIHVDADLVKDYEGEYIGLENRNEALTFTVYYESRDIYQTYRLLPSGLSIYDREEDEDYWVAGGETLELALNDDVSVSILEYMMLGHKNISNATLTSSDESVLALHGEPGINEWEGGSFSIKSTYLEPKKVGTSQLTVSFVYNGVTYTKTINVNVVLGAEKPGFGYYNENREFIPFVDGETIDVEQGARFDLFTNVSPRVLSNITVSLENGRYGYTQGNISETYVCEEDEQYVSAYYMRDYAYLYINSNGLGTTKLTMSAKYAGKTYTQTVTLNVIEPKGLQLRYVYTNNNEYFNVQGGRVDNIYINSGGEVTLYALYDDNAEGVTTAADASNYIIEVLQETDGTYEVSDDFRVVFVNDYIFYVLPLMDNFDYYQDDFIFRITEKVEEDEEAKTIQLPLAVNPADLFYLNCDETTGTLSNPVSAIQAVEGEETVFYIKLRANYGDNYMFTYANGLEMRETKTVYSYEAENEYDSWKIIKFVVVNNGTFDRTGIMSANIMEADKYWHVGELFYTLSDSTECDAPIATQAQISAFLNAEDSSCDISAENAVRYMDYVIALKTGANGEKNAIIVGYTGDETEIVSMPDDLDVFIILDNGTDAVHTMSYYAKIPVIGLDDGVFDTSKGYTQPERVHLYVDYTYLGTNYTGWVNPDSGKRTSYSWWSYDGEYDPTGFRIINDMVFTTVNEQLVCVDTGNASFAAVVPEGVVLYKNRTSGRTAIDLVKANSVSYYNLAKDYLYMVEGTGAAIEVPIKVEAENGQYYLSIDNAHENAAMLADLASGAYYMDLVPVITIEGQEIALAAQKCEVGITFDDAVPEVKITNSNVTVNTYLGNTCLVFFDVTNSFGTRVDSIAFVDTEKAAEAGLGIGQNGDGACLLFWDGDAEKIPSSKKITLEVAFGVVGYGTDKVEENEVVIDSEIKTQTITVNFKSIVPKTTLEKTTLTISEYPYSNQWVRMDIKDGRAYGRIDAEATLTEVISTPKGGNASDITVMIDPKNSFAGWVGIDVNNNAVPGTYKIKVTPALAPVRGEEERYYASAVTLTVNVKGTKPTIKFAEKLNVTLNSNFYNVTATLPGLAYATAASEQVSQGVMYDPANNVNVVVTTKSAPKNADASLVKLTPYYGGATGENVATGMYELGQITFVASVESVATAGNYTFDIKVPVMVDADVVWVATTATVKVVNTLPTFKLSESTITLDAAYPYDAESANINYSSAEIRLVMDEGYRLAGAQYTWGTNYNAYECIDITYNAEDGNGTIYFDVVRAGLTKGGTVTLTPKVIAPSGEELTLKPMKVTVKVTNSSKVTLNAKVKATTVNPYLGTITTKAQLSTKGFAEVAGVDYTYSYDFVPVDANAYIAEAYFAELGVAGLTVSADGSEIYASNWEGLPNGKYTYNLVEKITASDGTIIYTKPLTFTVTVSAKALTIVPAKSSINFYGDMGNIIEVDGVEYFMVSVPVSIKELPGEDVLTYVEELAYNSKDEAGVVTGFVSNENGGTNLEIYFPWQLYNSMKGLKITPYAAEDVYKEFATFTVNINYKTGAATSFKNATVTLDRYTSPYAENVLSDGESFGTYGMEIVSITKKGSKVDISNQFVWELNEIDGSPNYIKIAPKNPDTIANGTYVVTVTPIVGAYIPVTNEETGEVTNQMKLYYLNKDCSFNLNITQPKLSLGVSEKTVNLYPDLGEVTSSPISVTVLDGGAELPVSKVEVVGPTSKVVSTGIVNEENNTVTFGALAKEDGTYTAGSNTYNLKVYVKNYNGTADVLAGTISKAVTVKVKTLPTKVTLTNTKLTFSPYLEQSVTTSVKDAELAALMASGDYSYSINVVETNNKYKDLAEDKKNEVIVAVPDENGNIVITKNGTNFPENNATYYYTATISFQKEGEDVAQYSVNFQVAVKNTKPVAALQQASVTLNNAYLEQFAYNRVSLATGNSMWTLTAQDSWDIVVKDSKNKDITDKAILNAFMYDASDDGEVAVYTNDVVVSLWTADERGIIDVPKGNYKISLTPKATDGESTIDLAPVTMTVKVISNRPTVKFSGTKVTVNTYNNLEQSLKLTMSNGGDFVAYIADCTKFPKGVTTDEGITFDLATDGTLTVKASRDAKPGTYTYKFTPVTVIDGYGIALDAKNITVTVNNTLPTAVLSSNKVTLNSLFADDYYATIDVTAKNAGKYQYVFYTDAIKFADTKSTKQTVRDNAAILLDNMEVELYENGKATIVVMLPEDKTVANGTYKFTLTPSILTGDESKPSYDLKPVSFSVVVENKKPTLSAKVSGSIDLVNMNKNAVEIQLSFNKQNYETIGNMDGIRILDKGTGDDAWQFMIDYVDWDNGKIVLTNSTRLPAGKSYALQVEVTSTTGQVYLASCTVKTAQANYKITSGTSNFYTAINSGSIQLSATEGVYLNNVEVLKVTTDKGGKKVISGVEFDGRLGNNNTVEIWSNGNLPSTIKKGSTIYVQLEVTPYGLATNKQPTKITVPVTVK